MEKIFLDWKDFSKLRFFLMYLLRFMVKVKILDSTHHFEIQSNFVIRNKLVLRNFLRITNTINLLLDKELLLKLDVSEHEIVKRDFRKFFDQFWDFTLKRVPKICDPCII